MNCVNTLHSTCSKICQKAHKSPLLFFTSSRFPCPPPHKVSHTTLLFCPLQTHTLFFCPLFSIFFPLLETWISKVALHLTRGAFSAWSFRELLTHFGFKTSLLMLDRLLLFFGYYLPFLHINMAVITQETEYFPHQNSWHTCSAFYLSSPEWGAVSIQMANHQGFYTFTRSKNAEQRSTFSIMFWTRAGCAGFAVRADFPLAPPSASIQEQDRDKDHVFDAWQHSQKGPKRKIMPCGQFRIIWVASGNHSWFLMSEVIISSLMVQRIWCCFWKWTRNTCLKTLHFWSRRFKRACFGLKQPVIFATIASDCKRLTWKWLENCDLGLRQNCFYLTV